MSNYEPPRGDLFADPSAQIVWAAICTLDEATQHEVLHVLRERLALSGDRDTPHQVRIARAVAALREASDLLADDGRLSVDEYTRLRDAHPEHGWPPPTSIRRWLGGGWNAALRRAGLDEVPDGDITTYRLGSAITRDEAIAAVRHCADELHTVPTLSQYLFWAKSPEVRGRAGRRPTSQGPFDRLFGGWLSALVAAGLVDADAPAHEPSEAAGQTRPSGYRFTTEQIHDSLRAVAARSGRPPRTSEYIRERAAMLVEPLADGEVRRAMPSYNVINDRYPTWDDALIDAGLEPLGGRGTQSNPPRELKRSQRVTDEQILTALQEAYDDLGDPFTTTAYTRWRAEQLERARAERRMRTLPSVCTVQERFGTWAAGVAKALGR